MSTAWLTYLLLTGTLVAIAVVAVDAACRLARWPRRWAPFGGMLMLVALAFIAPENKPVNQVPFDPAKLNILVWEGAGANDPVVAPQPTLLATAITRIKSIAAALPNVVESILPKRFQSLYLAVWGVTSSVLLLLLVLVHMRFLRARRGWPIINLLGTDVRLSPAAGPAVVGAFRPDIVIPKWLLQREREQQELVLEHEREHVHSRDPLMLASAWTCAVAMPWHPAVWWMLWRLRLAVELDCDARVLSHGTARRSYGMLLIELSQQSSGLPVGATALSDRTTHLERRLLAMNANRPSFSALRSSAFALIAIAMIVSACAVRKPTTANEEVALPLAIPPQEEISLPLGTIYRGSDVSPGAVTSTVTAPDPLIIIDGVIQNAPTTAVTPTPSAARIQRFSSPVIIIDGVIQEQTAPPPPVPITPGAAPQTVPPPREPVVMVDGVFPIQPSVAPSPPPAGSTTSTPPPPPVRPGVITPSTVPQQGWQVRAFTPQSEVVAQQALGRPLIVVDGIIVASDTSALLGGLSPDKISSIDVLRGQAAINMYGERGRAGVLSITTKSGGRVGGRGGRAGVDTAFNPGDVAIQLGTPGAPPPMFIIDGVIQLSGVGELRSADDLWKYLGSISIESIEVVRGAAAIKLYGTRAVNGVVNIKTKR